MSITLPEQVLAVIDQAASRFEDTRSKRPVSESDIWSMLSDARRFDAPKTLDCLLIEINKTHIERR